MATVQDAGGLTTTEIVLAVLQVAVFLLSCPGNAVVVIVIRRYMNRKTITKKFIANLAIADFFTGLTALSQLLYTFKPSLNNNWYSCLLRFQVVIIVTLTSQLTVTFTTFDRLIAICYPNKYSNIMSTKHANILIAASWIYPCVLGILPIVGINAWQTHQTCVFQQIVTPWQLLWMTLTLWIFTLVTVVMYALILKKACSVYNKIRPLATINPISVYTQDQGQPEVTKNYLKLHRMTRVLRSSKALATVTLLFSLCWLPYTYFQFRAFLDPEYVYSLEWEVANWIVFLGMANSVLNPFIYAWQRKDFELAFKKLIRCKKPVPVTNRKSKPNCC